MQKIKELFQHFSRLLTIWNCLNDFKKFSFIQIVSVCKRGTRWISLPVWGVVGGENDAAATNEADAEQNPDVAPLFQNEEIDREILYEVIRAFDLVDQIKGSQSDFNDLLEYAKDLYCKKDQVLRKKWPKDYYSAKQLLYQVGHSDPTTYFICLDESHHSNWSLLKDQNEICRFCGKTGTIKAYYMNVKDKIKKWCRSESMCTKMTYHWRKEKDHWINRDGANGEVHYPLKEIWDGTRFAELSWFWDPKKTWTLPVFCKFCSSVISVEEVESSSFINDHYLVIWKNVAHNKLFASKRHMEIPETWPLLGIGMGGSPDLAHLVHIAVVSFTNKSILWQWY